MRAARKSEMINFRTPEGLRDRIQASALKNNRSMNSELVAVLEGIFPAADSNLAPSMSLRDWLAGQALAVLLQNTQVQPWDRGCARAYLIADAMLAERAKAAASL